MYYGPGVVPAMRGWVWALWSDKSQDLDSGGLRYLTFSWVGAVFLPRIYLAWCVPLLMLTSLSAGHSGHPEWLAVWPGTPGPGTSQQMGRAGLQTNMATGPQDPETSTSLLGAKSLGWHGLGPAVPELGISPAHEQGPHPWIVLGLVMASWRAGSKWPKAGDRLLVSVAMSWPGWLRSRVSWRWCQPYVVEWAVS